MSATASSIDAKADDGEDKDEDEAEGDMVMMVMLRMSRIALEAHGVGNIMYAELDSRAKIHGVSRGPAADAAPILRRAPTGSMVCTRRRRSRVTDAGGAVRRAEISRLRR